MDTNLAKFLGASDLIKTKEEVYKESMYEVFKNEYVSKQKDLTVTLWYSFNVISFYKITIKTKGQTFESAKYLQKLESILFTDYYASLDILTEFQTICLIKELEIGSQEILNKYNQYITIPVKTRNADIFKDTLVSSLQHYCSLKKVLDQHTDSSHYKLFRLLSNNVNHLIEKFNDQINDPLKPLVKEKLDGFYITLCR